MWLFMPFGFYSIVQKPGEKDLTVRARVRVDLDYLRDHYVPSLGPTQETPGHDYRYRAQVTHAGLAAGMGKMTSDLHYSNVKAETARQSGAAREKIYYKIHDHSVGLESLEKLSPAPKAASTKSPALSNPYLEPAYGGVVFNAAGQVLLVEPRGHHDQTVWTFPKGKQDAGETPEETALREVREESGIVGRTVTPLEGSYSGTTSQTSYFLMEFESDIGHFDHKETESILWLTPEEAKRHLAMTRKPSTRKRDLKVLETALAVRARQTNGSGAADST